MFQDVYDYQHFNQPLRGARYPSTSIQAKAAKQRKVDAVQFQLYGIARDYLMR
jgi:hypothetical protein